MIYIQYSLASPRLKVYVASGPISLSPPGKPIFPFPNIFSNFQTSIPVILFVDIFQFQILPGAEALMVEFLANIFMQEKILKIGSALEHVKMQIEFPK